MRDSGSRDSSSNLLRAIDFPVPVAFQSDYLPFIGLPHYCKPEHHDIEHYLQTGIVTVIPFFVINVYFFLIPGKATDPFSVFTPECR